MKRLLQHLLIIALVLPAMGTQGQTLTGSEFKLSLPLFQFSIILGPDARYAVDCYKINYTTVDVKGMPDTASGLVMVPKTTSIASPLTLVQHGTVSGRDDVPSNLAGGYELGAFFSALGYVTIMPDFIGLGDSDGLHPYVHADTEASAGVDMIFATKQFLDQQGITYNDQLFVTGYSQGGHAAMAAHQLLEESYADMLPVTASAPLSGPYSISTATKDGLLSDSTYFFPGYAIWTVMSYNEAYNLYDNIEEYIKQPYASYALQFKNEEIQLDSLQSLLIAQLTTDHGGPVVKFMFQDSLIAGVTNDENHPLNVALRDNDTYLWAPNAPTRLYYCMADDQVAFTNSVLADSVMNNLGAMDLDAIDVEPTADHGACVLPAGFATIAFFKQFASFTVSSTKDLPQLEGVTAFPNPSNGQIQINGTPEDAFLSIYDMQGRVVQTQQLRAASNSIAIDAPKGIYLFRVVAPEGVWNQQIVLQK